MDEGLLQLGSEDRGPGVTDVHSPWVNLKYKNGNSDQGKEMGSHFKRSVIYVTMVLKRGMLWVNLPVLDMVTRGDLVPYLVVLLVNNIY